ncbi:competence protein CoiA family protein [Aneurinibacillus danicus]|uniref:Competence protein CoiA-like N-terminal domain-containing protein n=1 Tax=Aneurinibacillus danicus TaxID=267746 RepID=A0A511VGL5_9BACL|nr:hypothetical protein [Aneurinibacillus danicus]GEN36693.1 hypothetical protein ADA01nite_41530 [Aneurinibacillus danicus]
MYSAIYGGFNQTTIEEEWRKYNGDLELIRNIGEKGGYTCPFCGSNLRIRAGNVYDRHFAHWSGTSCWEAKIQEKQIEKYKRQKKREAPTHPVIRSFIYNELKAQESSHKGVYIQHGVTAKAKERWTYYPDLILTIQDKEIAISVLTNVTPEKDKKLIRSIQKQNQFYREKGLEIVWFVEDREQTLNMHEHVIHLWASEVDLAIETAEDQKWTTFLKKLKQENHYSIFNVFGYVPVNDMDTKVKSLYYVSAQEEYVTFSVNRFILDGNTEPYQGFVFNEGYDMRMGTALSIGNLSLKLSDTALEEWLRNDFQKQYEEKLVSYIETLEEKKKRKQEEQQTIEEQKSEWMKHEKEKHGEHRKKRQESRHTNPSPDNSFFARETEMLPTISKVESVYPQITEEKAERLVQKIYKGKITAEEAKNLLSYMKSNRSFCHKIEWRRFLHAQSLYQSYQMRSYLVDIEYLIRENRM